MKLVWFSYIRILYIYKNVTILDLYPERRGAKGWKEKREFAWSLKQSLLICGCHIQYICICASENIHICLQRIESLVFFQIFENVVAENLLNKEKQIPHRIQVYLHVRSLFCLFANIQIIIYSYRQNTSIFSLITWLYYYSHIAGVNGHLLEGKRCFLMPIFEASKNIAMEFLWMRVWTYFRLCAYVMRFFSSIYCNAERAAICSNHVDTMLSADK